MTIGRMLRTARLATGYTQQECAAMAGLSLWTWNRIENGARHVTDAEWDRWWGRLPVSIRNVVLARQVDDHLTAAATAETRMHNRFRRGN